MRPSADGALQQLCRGGLVLAITTITTTFIVISYYLCSIYLFTTITITIQLLMQLISTYRGTTNYILIGYCNRYIGYCILPLI